MELTHEHREMRNSFLRIIEREINPHVEAWEEAGIFPAHEVFKTLGNAGLLGVSKPPAYGRSAAAPTRSCWRLLPSAWA